MSREDEDISPLIKLYALGELEEERIPLVEEYLRQHPEARRELEEIRQIMTTVGSESLEEPSPRLSASTRERVHALIAESTSRRGVSLRYAFARFFNKPAYASAAAVMVVALLLTAFLLLRQFPRPPTGPEGPGVTARGLAGTQDEELGEYVEHSTAVFQSVLEKDSAEIRQLLEGRDLTIDIGKAMKLLEDESVKENSDQFSLISDIEAVWRELRAFVEGTGSDTADEIKKEILEKRIVERARDAGISE
jgi:hypothetical protein